jgi:5''-3'' exonuclease (including N-terminal domain of PolI)
MIGLLDFDGYICKAFYASIARGEDDFEEMTKVLDDLTQAALDKLKDNFGHGAVIKVISGHTYKKDVYPSYKLGRKRNEDLGAFREYVKLTYEDLKIVPNLEADDVITMMAEDLGNCIVFSDDKDLRYYNPQYCKINIKEEIGYEADYKKKQLIQLLVGDKEDAIAGISKVGEKTAEKLLDMYGWNIDSVIEIYRDKQVTIDECLKNLLLISPIRKENVIDYRYGLDDSTTLNNILGHFRYWNEKVTEIYNK